MRQVTVGGKAYRSLRAACLALGVDYARARAIARAYSRAARDPALAIAWARDGVPQGEWRTAAARKDAAKAGQRRDWGRVRGNGCKAGQFTPPAKAPCRGGRNESRCYYCPQPFGCVMWRQGKGGAQGNWDRRIRCADAVRALAQAEAMLARLGG